MTVIAITGATGFVGKTVIEQALTTGYTVRALTRRPQPPRDGVTWIEGALDTPEALRELVLGSDAVLHIAGIVNAPNRAGFEAGNITGTRNIVAAAQAEQVQRFVHVSSLAAREPELSNYGWSKTGAEYEVSKSNLDWTMVRPPAIYGPADTEIFDMFRMAKRGIVMLPPRGRVSVIHVVDLARLLLALIHDTASYGQIYEADDGIQNGWSHKEFGQAIGRAVGRRIVTIAAPKTLLHIASAADRGLRRAHAKLTADRVSYLCHPDWVIDPNKRPPAKLWQPEVETMAGLAATMQWYRDAGWVK